MTLSVADADWRHAGFNRNSPTGKPKTTTPTGEKGNNAVTVGSAPFNQALRRVELAKYLESAGIIGWKAETESLHPLSFARRKTPRDHVVASLDNPAAGRYKQLCYAYGFSYPA